MRDRKPEIAEQSRIDTQRERGGRGEQQPARESTHRNTEDGATE